ncbi:MAG: polysaccharide biosynthesis/export family protein [Longimicrobiales bacterium]
MRAFATTALVAGMLLFAGAFARACAQGPAVRLRPGDAVRIEVRNEQGLSGEFILGADGFLLLPIIGTLKVADRPFAEVELDLRKAFANELVDPVLRITPLVRISVLGEVRAPGLFHIDPTFTVRDVLARAGGLMTTANPHRIVIRRPSGVVVAEFKLDSPPLDTKLGSGDEILVGRRSWASEHMGILLSAAGSVAVALITSAIIR